MWSVYDRVARILPDLAGSVATSLTTLLAPASRPREASQEDAHALVDLPDGMLCVIVENMLLFDALAFGCVCTSVQRAIGTICKERLARQLQTVVCHFPPHVVGSLPMSVWLSLEWINFSPKWMGSTDYIDKVHPRDVPGHPFKCCVDPYGRMALIMRRKTDVAVLFQRYSADAETWVFASNTLPIGGCRLSESMAMRLALWLANDYADFPSEDCVL